MTGTVWSYGPVLVDEATVAVSGGSGVPKTYVAQRAAGVAFTLPEAIGSGQSYRFIVGTTISSNALTIVTASDNDEFQGVIYQVDVDSTDAVAAYPAIVSDNFDTISLNGTTTGGRAGDWIELCDVADGIWAVKGFVNASGTVAAPIA